MPMIKPEIMLSIVFDHLNTIPLSRNLPSSSKNKQINNYNTDDVSLKAMFFPFQHIEKHEIWKHAHGSLGWAPRNFPFESHQAIQTPLLTLYNIDSGEDNGHGGGDVVPGSVSRQGPGSGCWAMCVCAGASRQLSPSRELLAKV